MCFPSSSFEVGLGGVIIPSFTISCDEKFPPPAAASIHRQRSPSVTGGVKYHGGPVVFLDWKSQRKIWNAPMFEKKTWRQLHGNLGMNSISFFGWHDFLISQSNLYHIGVFVMSNHTRFTYHEGQFSSVGCSPSLVQCHYVSFVISHAFHGPHGLQGCSCPSSTGAPKEPKQGGPAWKKSTRNNRQIERINTFSKSRNTMEEKKHLQEEILCIYSPIQSWCPFLNLVCSFHHSHSTPTKISTASKSEHPIRSKQENTAPQAIRKLPK